MAAGASTSEASMAKKRVAIPPAIRDAVLKEYAHRCAKCGADRPQVHHIDENPSNNDPLNLIPLCPNCHLTDQHNPTQHVPIGILRLFRRYKDPAILSPQFSVLYKRLKFLEEIDTIHSKELSEAAEELTRFVFALERGEFFAKEIKTLTHRIGLATVLRRPGEDRAQAAMRLSAERAQQDKKFRDMLQTNRDAVYELVMDLVKFQDWPTKDASS